MPLSDEEKRLMQQYIDRKRDIPDELKLDPGQLQQIQEMTTGMGMTGLATKAITPYAQKAISPLSERISSLFKKPQTMAGGELESYRGTLKNLERMPENQEKELLRQLYSGEIGKLEKEIAENISSPISKLPEGEYTPILPKQEKIGYYARELQKKFNLPENEAWEIATSRMEPAIKDILKSDRITTFKPKKLEFPYGVGEETTGIIKRKK